MKMKIHPGCIFNLNHELIPIVISLTTTACLGCRVYAMVVKFASQLNEKMFVKSDLQVICIKVFLWMVKFCILIFMYTYVSRRM